MLRKLFSRHFYRSFLFWILLLLVSYTTAGFLAVPALVKSQLEQNVQTYLGWQTSVGEVRFHPWRLRLNIDALSIQTPEGQQTIAFDALEVDFDAASVIEQAFLFENIELTGPFLFLHLLPDGVNNFTRALSEAAAGAESTAAEEAAAENPPAEGDQPIPPVGIANLIISDGRLQLRNAMREEPIEHEVQDLDLNIDGFATYLDEDDPLELAVTLPDQQSLSWTGVVNTPARTSSGTLTLNGLLLHRLWVYTTGTIPYDLTRGNLQFAVDYEVGLQDDALSLSLSDGRVRVSDLALNELGEETPFATVAAVDLQDIQFQWPESSLQVGAVEISQPVLALQRNAEGDLVQMQGLQQMAQDDPDAGEQESAPASATDSSPFRFSVGSVNLLDGELRFTDAVPATEAKLALLDLNLGLTGLSENLDQAVPFELSWVLEPSVASQISGEITPATTALNATIDIPALQLGVFEPYLQEFAAINLEGGSVRLQGQAELPPNAPAALQFQGELSLDDFDIRDKRLNQPLLGWSAISAQPLSLNMAQQPLALTVGELALVDPKVLLMLDETGRSNVENLFYGEAEEEAQELRDERPVQKADEEVPDIRIDLLSFSNGLFDFTDESLPSPYVLELSEFNGRISDLSSDFAARSQVDLSGLLDQSGKLSIAGKANPLRRPIYLDLGLDVSNFNLPSVSPYSGKFVGRKIRKGKLNLDLDYLLEDRRLASTNVVALDQLSLGGRVDSPDATALPVDLAVVLLKDINGRIDIDLPVNGSFDDPQFSVGALILQGLTNLITKAVASPFNLIGSLAMGGESLQEIGFAPGQSTLEESKKEVLAELVQGLAAKPELALEMRGVADPELDTQPVKRNILELLKAAQQREQGDAADEVAILKGVVNKIPDATIQLSAWQTEQGLEEPDADQLEEFLMTQVELPRAELQKLARSRATAVREQLLAAGLESDRLFVLEPGVLSSGGTEAVPVEFGVTVR